MSGASDETLLAGMAAGDRDAAARFVRRYQSRVYGLAHSILVDPGAAEDVAQEAFVRAWRHAETYDPRKGAAAAWLLTITRRLAIDAWRLRRADPFDPDTLAALVSDDDGPEEMATGAADAQAVRRALEQLPSEQRRALVMVAWQGRTAKEISEVEGIPLGTAKTRIRAGLTRLRRALSPLGERV